MAEPSLDSELETLRKKLRFLWEDHGFHIKHFVEKEYGNNQRCLLVGLGNQQCKLMLVGETNVSVKAVRCYVGTKSTWFIPSGGSYSASYGWYSLPGLIDWLGGAPYQADKEVRYNLEVLGQSLKHHLDRLIDLMKLPNLLEKQLGISQTAPAEHEITLENIRAEQARLQTLGQDSSVEAAMTSLRGGTQ